jgi:hypothetical protein
MEGWLFTAFVLSIALKLPLFPFHRRIAVCVPELRPGTRGLATVLPLLVGTYLTIRFLVPLFPELLTGHGVWLVSLLLVGLWGSGLSMSREDDPRRATPFLTVAAGAVAAIGVVSFSVEGVLGGVLLAVAAGAGLFIMAQLADAADVSDRESHEENRTLPVGAAAGSLAFASWPGVWLVVLGISRNALLLPGKLFLGLPLLIAPLVMAGLSLVRWVHRMRDLRATETLQRSGALQRGAATVGVVLLVAIGVGAPWMLSRTEPTVARYLRQELPSSDADGEEMRSSHLPRAPVDTRTAELTVEALP